MALNTSVEFVGPQDGWVLVAESPNYINIRNRTSRPWQLAVVAVASGTPASGAAALTFSPISQDDGHYFVKETVSVGDFYIRVLEDGPMGEKTEFAITQDV